MSYCLTKWLFFAGFCLFLPVTSRLTRLDTGFEEIPAKYQQRHVARNGDTARLQTRATSGVSSFRAFAAFLLFPLPRGPLGFLGFTPAGAAMGSATRNCSGLETVALVLDLFLSGLSLAG